MKVGIDNYGLYPLGLDPLETLEWAHKHGAQGVAFSGLEDEQRAKCTQEYLHRLVDYAQERRLYIEWGNGQHIPRDMNNWERKDLLDINRRAAQEAALLGTRIIRSCSGGLMRWHRENPDTETLLHATARALREQKGMLQDYNVILAIETHFEFTTFELLRLFDMCDAEPGQWVGICLDTMNLMTLLEDPVTATERILPWVVSTHIKDGGLLLTTEGMTSFVTGVGTGAVDLRAIIGMLRTLPRSINLSVEDHGGDFKLPIFETDFMKEFPDLTVDGLTSLLELVKLTEERMAENACRITDREIWPEVCEERMIQDIRNLKKLLQ